MGTEAGQGEETDGQRVPIEEPDVPTRPEVGEEGHVELALLVERDSTDDVAEGHTEDEDEQGARCREDEIPEGVPERMVQMASELDGDPAQDQEPEDQEEGEVVAGECGREDGWECQEEQAASADEPDLVPAPQRADGFEHLTALVLAGGHEEPEHTRAERTAVEHDVGRDHDP